MPQNETNIQCQKFFRGKSFQAMIKWRAPWANGLKLCLKMFMLKKFKSLFSDGENVF